MLDYIKENEKLMNEWIARHKEGDGKISFAKDGIVDPIVWFNLPENEEKILFLLKEAYEVYEENIWDQTKWIRKNPDDPCTEQCNKNCSECGATGYTFNPIAEWVYGIHRAEQNKNAEYDNWIGLTGEDRGKRYKDERDKMLRRVAIINIKKSSGDNSSDNDDLYYYAAKDKDLLLRQIELIKPTLIICGNTFGMLRCLYPEIKAVSSLTNGNTRYEKFKVIAACHPSNPCSGKKKYDNVMSNYFSLIKGGDK